MPIIRWCVHPVEYCGAVHNDETYVCCHGNMKMTKRHIAMYICL